MMIGLMHAVYFSVNSLLFARKPDLNKCTSTSAGCYTDVIWHKRVFLSSMWNVIPGGVKFTFKFIASPMNITEYVESVRSPTKVSYQ